MSFTQDLVNEYHEQVIDTLQVNNACYNDLFTGLKDCLINKIDNPYTYYTQSKYTTYCKEQFKSIDEAINHAKEFLNKYFETGILSCNKIDYEYDVYNNHKKVNDFVCYEIKGIKYNHTIIFKVFVLNNSDDLKNDLKNLIQSYNDFINFNDDTLNNDYNLKDFIPCKDNHTASYSFSSSSLSFINKNTLEVRSINYDWQDYEYSDASMRDTHDYYIEKFSYNINNFAQKLYSYSKLLKAKGKRYMSAGAIVKVVKGRKVPKGTTGIIKGFQDITDCYRRYQGQYAIFEDGTKTNKNNLELIGFVSNKELARFI